MAGLPSGGENESVRGLHPALYIRLEAKETDALFQTKSCGKLKQFALERAGACDQELCGIWNLHHGRKQGRIVFDRLQPASRQPEKLPIDSKLHARQFADREIGSEDTNVHTIGHNAEFFFGDHRARKVWSAAASLTAVTRSASQPLHR